MGRNTSESSVVPLWVRACLTARRLAVALAVFGKVGVAFGAEDVLKSVRVVVAGMEQRLSLRRQPLALMVLRRPIGSVLVIPCSEFLVLAVVALRAKTGNRNSQRAENVASLTSSAE